MRKFKLFFYPIYLLTIILVLYYSFDILSNMDSYKERIDITFALKKLPIYLMVSFIFLTLLMITEFVVENYQIIKLKSKLKKAEDEVTKYKAKLYDRSEEQASRLPQIEEEEADDGDDDDEWIF